MKSLEYQMVAVVVEPVESSWARLVDDAAGQGAVGEAVCKSCQ